ncbi:F-box/LRR-repeat protein At5g63520 isoform X2 [Vicia villosa]|uniref:F-box/LRR-repeat protein At5g63520 isoform X2 n=1 Tax=Vicia villosa TaxID=3911 RepID=UPI00273C0377|nr:F-box/LRR-repeat protein At5g63520 isoform X2 [Vicia villosa]
MSRVFSKFLSGAFLSQSRIKTSKWNKTTFRTDAVDLETTMEEAQPSSSSARSITKGKSSNDLNTGITLLNDDLLHNILPRLPALSFASASCVSKSWNSICTRIISRPKLSSALSLNPSLREAVKEVVDKVLSEPIRPHFAIVNIGCGFDANKILRLIKQKLGLNIPVIVTVNNGIIGRDALTDEFKEVKWGARFSGIGDDEYARHFNEGIVLTIGCLPGMKAEAIPLLRPVKTPQELCVDNFVMDIKEYTASVSGRQFPVGVILFGEASTDMKLVLEKLDYAMPKDTVIVGDERGCSVFRYGNDSRNAYSYRKGFIEAVALVFAQDRTRSSGNIRFHVAFSIGVSPVGGKYKAASVRTNSADYSTWLTAKREWHQEPLDGETILHDINTLLENHIEPPELYIGVTKNRKVSIGAEKPMPRTCIAYHGVVGGDEEYLYVDGMGIKTGDIFQFYHSDPNAALASLTEVRDALNNMKLERNSRSVKGDGEIENATNVFGGILFACYGRGHSFFGRPNADSSPFLEIFPGVPLAGIFCCGEMVRPCTTLIGQSPDAKPISCFLHVYSSVYLVMSYDPPSVEH